MKFLKFNTLLFQSVKEYFVVHGPSLSFLIIARQANKQLKLLFYIILKNKFAENYKNIFI